MGRATRVRPWHGHQAGCRDAQDQILGFGFCRPRLPRGLARGMLVVTQLAPF
ncbi:unnamed protein product [Ixodes pacificus]